jgi:hypothetical protein
LSGIIVSNTVGVMVPGGYKLEVWTAEKPATSANPSVPEKNSVLLGPVKRVGFDSINNEEVVKFEITKVSDELIRVYDSDNFEGKRVSFSVGEYTTL